MPLIIFFLINKYYVFEMYIQCIELSFLLESFYWKKFKTMCWPLNLFTRIRTQHFHKYKQKAKNSTTVQKVLFPQYVTSSNLCTYNNSLIGLIKITIYTPMGICHLYIYNMDHHTCSYLSGKSTGQFNQLTRPTNL